MIEPLGDVFVVWLAGYVVVLYLLMILTPDVDDCVWWLVERGNMLGITYLLKIIVLVVAFPFVGFGVFCYEWGKRLPTAWKWLTSRPDEER